MTKSFHTLSFAALTVLAVFPLFAAGAPTSPHTVTANVNLVSEYRFRGIDQTWGNPALQGGADYSHADGWYAGIWGSNVSGNSYAGGNLEIDYYAGYNGKLGGDLGWTAGVFGYHYPGADFSKAASGGPGQKFDNFEVNAGLSWKWISYKLSVSTTDYFGANGATGYSGDTRGSLYHDLSVAYPLADDLTLGLHIGRTNVSADTAGGLSPDYSDYKLSIAKTFKDGWNVSAAWVQSGNDGFFKSTASLMSNETRSLNKGVLVLQAGRTF